MKKYIKTYIFLIVCCTISSYTWAQSDTLKVNKEGITKSKVKIAYGERDKENLSSSISSVSGEELHKGSISNFGNALFGKFSGLYVGQRGGQPGSDSPSIRIRGGIDYPLVIIDGFERDLTYIAPEEIESVSVLKDASALALYGMKGANGAIVITTKRGKKQKDQISLSIQSGIQTPQKTMDVLGSEKYMKMHNQASLNDGVPVKYTDADIAAAGTSPLYPDVNWKDLLLRDFTNITRANLGLTGGSDFIKYYVNLGALYNNGIYEPENPDVNSNVSLSRLNIRSNIDVQVSKSTLFTLDLAGSIDKNIRPANNTSLIWNSILTLPPNEYNPVNPDGSYGGSYLFQDNPLAMLEYVGENSAISNFLNASFTIKQDLGFITEGLSAGISYVIDNGSVNNYAKWRQPEVKSISGLTNDTYEYVTYGENSSLNESSTIDNNRSLIYSGFANYIMPENNGNKLDVLLRFQGEEQYLSRSDITPYLTNNISGRIAYSKDNKYLLEFAASYYGSDQYKDGDQYGFFPAASVGWVFSNENFANGSNLLTYGKVRASYGLTGYSRYIQGRYPYMQFYQGGGGFPFGADWATKGGIQPGVIANENITWETSKKLNVGVEFELFNKLYLEADYYQNKRDDALVKDNTYPSVSGARVPFENIGKITDTGVDVTLGYTNTSNEVKWNADVIFSYYENTTDEIGESLNTGDLARLNQTGKSISTIFGYEVIGYFKDDTDIAASPTQTFGTPRVGDFKYKDFNNDGVIDSRDRTEIGNGLSNIDMGFRLGAEYKNFDAEVLFQGQFNRDLNISNSELTNPFIYGNAVTEIAEESDFPALTLTNKNNYQQSSYWIRNGDFLKLRNVEIGYSLGQNLLSALRMKKARIFLRGNNILTFSKWKYTDPEYVAIGYPPMKTYLLGINIDF